MALLEFTVVGWFLVMLVAMGKGMLEMVEAV